MFKLSRGTFAILLMVTVALGLSIYATWYRYQAGDDALRFWGRDAAIQIRGSQKVELLVLTEERVDEPAAETKEPAAGSKSDSTLEIQGTSYTVAKTIDITTAPGLIHARNALLEDASLDAKSSPPSSPPRWDRVLRFENTNAPATAIAIDLETGWICRTDTGNMIKLKKPDFKQEKRDPGLVAYVKKFTAEKVEEKESNRSAPRGMPEK